MYVKTSGTGGRRSDNEKLREDGCSMGNARGRGLERWAGQPRAAASDFP